MATWKTLTLWQNVRLLHRAAILGFAVYYVLSSIRSLISVVTVLTGTPLHFNNTRTYSGTLMKQQLGNDSIYLSPLLQTVLANDTSPRNHTLYLEANGTSKDACHKPKFIPKIYSNANLRSTYASLVSGTKHAHSFMTKMEVIAPVVDCSLTLSVNGDRTRVQYYLLLRNISALQDVYVLSLRLTVQDYAIEDQRENGPCGLLVFAAYNTMKTTNLTHHFAGAPGFPYSNLSFRPYEMLRLTDTGFRVFRTVPINNTESVKTVLGTRSTGVFVKSSTDRSNIKRSYWSLDKSPAMDVTRWFAASTTVLRSSWAWVHFVHLFFALDALFYIALQFLITASAIRNDKIWIGDAFMSISTTLSVRALMILVCWWIESFWTLAEYCLYVANALAGVQSVTILYAIMHADLMTFYLFGVMVVGHVFHEKIDPVLAMLAFELSWQYAVPLTKLFTGITASLSAFAVTDYNSGTLAMSAELASKKVMRYWTAHELSTTIDHYMFLSIAPILSTLIVFIPYALLRKVYHYFYPEQFSRQTTNPGSAEDSSREMLLLSQQRTLTVFEIATGAALQNRVGLVADYENCRIIKGMKYASPDGIYSSGFVIANGKFLVASVDLPTIIAMKILRW